MSDRHCAHPHSCLPFIMGGQLWHRTLSDLLVPRCAHSPGTDPVTSPRSSAPCLLPTSLSPCPLAFPFQFHTQAVKSNHDTCLLCIQRKRKCCWGMSLPFATITPPLQVCGFMYDTAENANDKMTSM